MNKTEKQVDKARDILRGESSKDAIFYVGVNVFLPSCIIREMQSFYFDDNFPYVTNREDLDYWLDHNQYRLSDLLKSHLTYITAKIPSGVEVYIMES